MNPESTSIVRVSYFQASPVHCCDRCSQGIKHVFSVLYKDGLRQEYGMECIKKIMESAPTLAKLFQKNTKLLQKRQRALHTLSLPVEQMPRGREYFNSGMYFIADETGEDIFVQTHWLFHPLYDVEKNAIGPNYIVHDPEKRAKELRADIERDKVWLKNEIERLEAFLAKVLRSAAKQSQQQEEPK